MWLSVVVTNGVSDWSQQPAPAPDADGLYESAPSARATRSRSSAATSRSGSPRSRAGDLQSGPMCAAPKGPGFTPPGKPSCALSAR